MSKPTRKLKVGDVVELVLAKTARADTGGSRHLIRQRCLTAHFAPTPKPTRIHAT